MPSSPAVSVVAFCLAAALAGGSLLEAPARAPQPSPATLGPRAAAHARLLSEALTGLRFADGRATVTTPLATPADLGTALARVAAERRRGEPFAAIARAAEAVRAYPRAAEAWRTLAEALLGRLRTAEAAACLRTALALTPDDARLYHELGLVLHAARQRPEAIAAWRRALALDPGLGPAHARLAAACFLEGELDCAREAQAEAARLGTPAPPQLAALLEGGAPRAPAGGGILPRASAPVRVDTGGSSQAAETIVTAGTGSVLVAGWNDLRQAGAPGSWRLGAAVSLDGGATWTDSIVRPPGGQSNDFEGDPMVAHDPRTGTDWVGGVLFGYVNQRANQLYVARRQSGGTGWLPSVTITGTGFLDKPLLVAGPRPGLPNTTRLYVAFNKGVHFSDDLGATWSALTELPLSVAQVPRLGPNGVLSIGTWEIGLDYKYLRSTNGGVTFSSPTVAATRLDFWNTDESAHVPGSFRVAPVQGFAVDPNDGTLYLVYADSSGTSGTEENADIYFTRSTNNGQTWTTPIVLHGDSSPPRDQFHPWIEVDATGRLHVAFFDTRYTAQLDADPDAFLDVTYATSTDRGTSWSEMRVTPQSWSTGLADWPGFSDQFVGDYLGLTVVGDRVHLLYPATPNGNLDIWTQVLDYGAIFADGFESGGLTGWDAVGP